MKKPAKFEIVKKIGNCARCKRNHKNLRFERLTHPVFQGKDIYTHWAPCPRNGQPILMAINVGL